MLFWFLMFLVFSLLVFFSDITLFNRMDQEKEIKNWRDWIPFFATTILTFLWVLSISELGKLIFPNIVSEEDLYKSVLAFVAAIVIILLVVIFKTASLPEYTLYITQILSIVKPKTNSKNNN